MRPGRFLRLDAPWKDLWEFALTYDGYGRHGSFEDAADVANATRMAWEQQGVLPNDLDEVRCSLFFEQRRWRQFGDTPDGRDEEYIRLLLAAVAELSDGQVHVDPQCL